MECRENDAEQARKEAFEKREEIRAQKRKTKQERKEKREFARLMEASAKIYIDMTTEEETYVLWDSTLRVLLSEAEEYGLETEARYYKAMLFLDPESYKNRLEGKFESVVNAEKKPKY